MPFKSKKQKAYLAINVPKVHKKWSKTYGKKTKTTSKGKSRKA
jgi:hypothetical protein|tara:strand:+ start:106 stop:234 length:129 start_codon:yes stop_codon:yes gene_type:complete